MLERSNENIPILFTGPVVNAACQLDPLGSSSVEAVHLDGALCLGKPCSFLHDSFASSTAPITNAKDNASQTESEQIKTCLSVAAPKHDTQAVYTDPCANTTASTPREFDHHPAHSVLTSAARLPKEIIFEAWRRA